MSPEDLIGKTFHWLEVLEPLSLIKAENRRQKLICVCLCGNLTSTRKDELLAGTTRSCGCYKGSQEWYEEQFFKNVKKTDTCWLWTGYIGPLGYGRISTKCEGAKRGYSKKHAHRAAYEMFKGEVPDDLVVRHMCHNKTCVNPDHLEIGTHQDNMNDMVEANRQAKGERAGRAKLTEFNVKEIRLRYKNGEGQREIAKEFSVSQCTVNHIIIRKTWKHI